MTGSEGGSCTGTAESGSALLDCTDFDNGDGAVLDGTIGLTSAGDEDDATDTITSEDLTMTFDDGASCDVVLNMTVARECNDATLSGCLSVCDTPFTIDLSETLEGM